MNTLNPNARQMRAELDQAELDLALLHRFAGRLLFADPADEPDLSDELADCAAGSGLFASEDEREQTVEIVRGVLDFTEGDVMDAVAVVEASVNAQRLLLEHELRYGATS